jgi:hypothetical protein
MLNPTEPEIADTPELAPEVVETPTTEAPESQPGSMLEAMQRVWERDDQGRFAGGVKEVPGEPAKAPEPAAVAAPVAPVKPEAEDITAMPDGLGAKAQERFQKLVSANKETAEQLNYVRSVFKTQEHFTQAAEAVRAFEEHRIQPEQFQQAVGFLAAINRGDFSSAQQMLTEQLRQVTLMTGQTVPGVDALAEYPDLRQAVDGFQITEQHAVELARMRNVNRAQTQRDERVNTERQSAQSAQQAVDKAVADVDAWTRQMAAQDIDWPAVETQVLPHLKELVAGVPPQRWLNVVQAHVKALKGALANTRPAATSEPAPLRPMGAGATQRAPKTMFEAMFPGA